MKKPYKIKHSLVAATLLVSLGNIDIKANTIPTYINNGNAVEKFGFVKQEGAPTFANKLALELHQNDVIYPHNDSLLFPTFVDIDGDGDYDMVAGGSFYPDVFIFKNIGDSTSPSFDSMSMLLDGKSKYADLAPAFVDIDGDGDYDAISGLKDGTIDYYENYGDSTTGTFGTSVKLSPLDIDVTGQDKARSAPSLADIDGDGDYDMVVGVKDGTLNYYENEGNSTSASFGTSVKLSADSIDIDVGIYAKPSFVDIDRDGDYDLVVGGTDYFDGPDGYSGYGVFGGGYGGDNGHISYYENVGDSTNASFTAPVILNAGGSTIGATSSLIYRDNVVYKPSPTFVDLDGDGDYDMVVGQQDGFIDYYENTSPSISNQFLFSQFENNRTVATLNGYDADNDNLIYGIDSSYKDGVKFSIDSSTGELSFLTAPDYENPTDVGGDNVYDVNLTISDGLSSNWTVAEVNVTNIDEITNITPTDINLSKNTIVENTQTGTTIGVLNTIDVDTADTFTYRFCGGTNDANFTINGNELKLNKVFDYETTTSQTVCIKTTDSGSATFDKNITINITNTDESKSGVCGTSNKGTFETAPKTALCMIGLASSVIKSGDKFNWSCSGTIVGSDTGTNASCTANVKEISTGGSASNSGDTGNNDGDSEDNTNTGSDTSNSGGGNTDTATQTIPKLITKLIDQQVDLNETTKFSYDISKHFEDAKTYSYKDIDTNSTHSWLELKDGNFTIKSIDNNATLLSDHNKTVMDIYGINEDGNVSGRFVLLIKNKDKKQTNEIKNGNTIISQITSKLASTEVVKSNNGDINTTAKTYNQEKKEITIVVESKNTIESEATKIKYILTLDEIETIAISKVSGSITVIDNNGSVETNATINSNQASIIANPDGTAEYSLGIKSLISKVISKIKGATTTLSEDGIDTKVTSLDGISYEIFTNKDGETVPKKDNFELIDTIKGDKLSVGSTVTIKTNGTIEINTTIPSNGSIVINKK